MVQIAKKNSLPITLIAAVLLIATIVSAGWALDSSTPAVSSFAPAQDAIITSTAATVSLNIYDPDEIMSSGFFIKLNGTAIGSSLKFKGHEEYSYDSCGNPWSYWIVDSYKEAVVSGNVSGLKDGSQTVEVQAKDKLGNILNKTWTFTVSVPPVFSNLAPVGLAWQPANPTVSVKLTDPNGQVDPASIKLAIDNPVALVEHSYNAATGVVSYTVPAPGLLDGVHTAYISAKDNAGNEGAKSWIFNVHAAGPQLTFGNAGKAYSVFNPAIKVVAEDSANVSSSGYEMYIDGQKVNPSFNYETAAIYDSCGAVNGTVADTTKAYLRYAVGLADGQHILQVKAKDGMGNLSDQSWNFQIAQAPALSNLTPGEGASVNGAATISAKVYDPNGPELDYSKLSLSVDGKPVVFSTVYNADKSIVVSYTDVNLSNDANHTAALAAADSLGNTVLKEWKFYDGFVGAAGQFSRFLPEDLAVTTAKPSFQVHFSDPNKAYDVPPIDYIPDSYSAEDAVQSGSRVLIDGSAQTDPARGFNVKLPVVAGTSPEYVLSYSAEELSDGDHTITFTIPSLSGGEPAVFSKTFTVKSAPVILRHQPVNVTTTSTPTITVTAGDNVKAIKAVFTVDGSAPVTVNSKGSTSGYEPNPLRITFPYTGPRLADGKHLVSAVVYDAAGLPSELTWTFTVDTNLGAAGTAMPVNNNASCQACHPTAYRSASAPQGQHPTVPSCGGCHSQKLYLSGDFQYCTTCHYVGPSFSYRHVSDGYVSGWADLPYVRHPLSDVHLSTTAGCEKCHSRVLTVEHNGKTDRNGNPITCDTCHTDKGFGADYQNIANAVKNKDTSCTACHTKTDHEAVHKDELDANCRTCHAGSLTAEHMNNQTTAGKNYSCATCHSNTGKEAVRTIAAQSLNCAGCHKQGHGIALEDKVPADIPLYSGYLWTTPIEAIIFSGSEAPTGYESGQVVLSNRLASVTPGDVWVFYNTKLSAAGWMLKSSAPAADAALITSVFAKDLREVTVKAFNTQHDDGTGSNAQGCRIELWYK